MRCSQFLGPVGILDLWVDLSSSEVNICYCWCVWGQYLRICLALSKSGVTECRFGQRVVWSLQWDVYTCSCEDAHSLLDITLSETRSVPVHFHSAYLISSHILQGKLLKAQFPLLCNKGCNIILASSAAVSFLYFLGEYFYIRFFLRLRCSVWSFGA